MMIRRRGRNNRGTTLIEIIVVMVILLVGIMTIVQMFPSGFAGIRYAESRTIATKLAEAELERWKSNPESIPDGILAISPVGAFLNNQFAGPPFNLFEEGVVDDDEDFVRGNVLNIRQVFGETTTIPVGTYFQTGMGSIFGSRYTLALGPIDFDGTTDPESGAYLTLTVRGGDLRRRILDRDQNPAALRNGEYAVAYSNDSSTAISVAFPANPSDSGKIDLYQVIFSYWYMDGSDRVIQSQSKSISLDPGYNGGWCDISPAGPGAGNFIQTEEETDTCARAFKPLPDGEDWNPNDPYQFVMADPILGVIAFNPTGHGRFERTAQGLKPLKARIDYRIYDPRIMREDHVIQPISEDVDENGTDDHSPVKLALKFILNAGESDVYNDGDPTDNADEPTFEGLIRTKVGHKVTEEADLVSSDSVMIIDLATGLRVAGDVRIDFRAGVVNLPETADLMDYTNATPVMEDVELSGRHLRFLYRADGDWSVQVQKAYFSYVRDWTSSAVDYRHYAYTNDSTHPNRMWFAKCDSGKSVAVDYSWAGSDGVPHKVIGECHRISDDAVTLGSGEACYIDLKVGSSANVDRIYAVVGVSFTARVIWRDGKYWRFMDLNTNLLRK